MRSTSRISGGAGRGRGACGAAASDDNAMTMASSFFMKSCPPVGGRDARKTTGVYNGGRGSRTRRGYNSAVRFPFGVILIISASAVAGAGQTSQPPATDAPPRPQFSEAVEGVAVPPVHGLEVPKTKVAANVQIFTPPRVPALAPSDASRLLAERAVSVHTTDTQAGTFQPD